ncbi:MAG TPA: hypothetical protein RMH99_09065 [Sandaracinaceae bacterium LLY-WYZ-13_1]|nr:hypothetical protein [Sandaracinaceae bacterium LLY-WYZ-13_1]
MPAPDPLDGYLTRRDDALVLSVPVVDRLLRGASLLFGLAPAVALGPWVVAWVLSPGGTGLAVTALVSSLAGGAIGLAGWLVMLGARRHAARSTVRLDLAERLIVWPSRAPEVLRDPAAVEVAAAGPFGWRLLLRDEAGRATRLLDGVPRIRGRAIAHAADRIGDALDAPVHAPASARRAASFVPRSRRRWAALCYAPVDGVFWGYALLALVGSRHPPLRFAAIQSLAQLGLEALLGSLLLGCAGAPVWLLADALPAGLVGLGLLCPLAALALYRVVVRVVAAVRAERGEVWVMPWLAFLVRRWAPTPERPAATEPTRSAGPPEPAEDAPASEEAAAPAERTTPVASGPW